MNTSIDIRARCCLFALLSSLLLSPCRPTWSAEQDRKPTASAFLLTEGTADLKQNVLCIRNSESGIDAIDLRGGKTLWKSTQAGTPLIIGDGKLMVLGQDQAAPGNSFYIFVLDISSGKQLLKSQPIEGIQNNTLGVLCYCQPKLEKDDLVLQWAVSTYYCGGAAPAGRQKSHWTAHSAAINLRTGDVKIGESSGAPLFEYCHSGTVAPPANLGGLPLAVSPLPDNLAKITSSSYSLQEVGSICDPLVLDGKLVAFEKQQAAFSKTSDLYQLSLKSWDLRTGEPHETVQLMQAKQPMIQVTGDRRYFCVLQMEATPPPGHYLSTIFSTDTGRQIGELKYASELVGVYDQLAFFVEGVSVPISGTPPAVQPVYTRQLKAFDLNTGKLVWQHQIAPVRRYITFPT